MNRRNLLKASLALTTLGLPAFPVFAQNTKTDPRGEPFDFDRLKQRAKELAGLLLDNNLGAASCLFHNSLEAPVFAKHAVLPVIKRFFHDNGAIVSMMSGSGATMIALLPDRVSAEKLRIKYHERFGQPGWSRTVLL